MAKGGRARAEEEAKRRENDRNKYRERMQKLFFTDPMLQKLQDPELFLEFSKVQETEWTRKVNIKEKARLKALQGAVGHALDI